MWNAATQVGTLFSLLAFVVAAGVAVWRARLKRRLEVIQSAAEPERVVMAQTVLDGVAIDTTNLTKAQRFELARDTLERRAARFQWAIGALLGIALLAAAVAAYYRPAETHPGLHHLRVTVVDTEGHPIEASSVSTSIGGEVKKTAAGWEIDIAEAAVPANRQINVWAEGDGRRGSVAVRVPTAADGISRQVPVTVRLPAPPDELVRGLVTDAANRALAGARVSIVGGDGVTTTGPDGTFLLPAAAAAGEEVRLRVEHSDYSPVEQYHLLGGEPARVVLGDAT